MKLGVFFIGNPRSGGLFQYSLNILDSLKSRKESVLIFNISGDDFPSDEYKSFFKVSRCLSLLSLGKHALSAIQKKGKNEKTGPEKSISRGSQVAGNKAILNRLEKLVIRLLLKLNRIDLCIFTAPNTLCFTLGTPFIMPVHDLQHRLNPQFPEVSAGGIGEEREYLYKNSISTAAVILVDSNTGKEDVLNFYRAEKDKIKVLPYTPPNYLRRNYSQEEMEKTRQKHQLPSRFIFYPAGFWLHKNHKLIIQALNHIKTKYNLNIPAVFVGSRENTYSSYPELQELIKASGLEDSVHYLGYVDNDEMGCLYKLAEMLVMPTYFGPTNIPYLEAFYLGCPVIGSDIRGIKEQIGDAGLLVNPDSSENLADAVLKIWNDPVLREKLIKKGYDKAEEWDFDKFSATLNIIIDEVSGRSINKRLY
jgi:glycosyltransferase involved in cell wall biosynthesis